MTDQALLEAPLPARRRGKALTRAGTALAAVLIGGLGFLGGVRVQKAQDDSGGGGTGGFAGGQLPGGGGGEPPGADGQGSGATIGEVSSVDGTTFYVEDASGNTIRVRAGKKTKVSRNAVADADEIHPGDTVVVQGRTANSGTVVATTVVATASNAESGAGLLGFGGGGGTRGPAQSTDGG